MSGFSIYNLHSDQSICPNIGKLHEFIGLDYYDKKIMAKINLLVDNITDDEIMTDARFAQHPFLHELCHQNTSSFPLLKELWTKPIFKNYWNNLEYLDKYGNTALERLAICLYGTDEDIDKIIWIQDNIGVIPCQEEINGTCNGKYLADCYDELSNPILEN